MGIGHRLVATLGFVVPAALAAWITLGVDAHARARARRPGRLHRAPAGLVARRPDRSPRSAARRGHTCWRQRRRVELDVALGVQTRDVARAKRTLARAGYDRWVDERWGGVAL